MSPLHALPDHSRLWLLALASLPDRTTEARLRRGLEEILAQWRHKGQVYQGVSLLLEPQLIAVAEPNLATQPSGCAIDGMLRKVRRLVEDLHLTLMDPAASILVRTGDRLAVIPKPDVQARLDDGTLDGGTPVVDLSLYSLEDLRAGRLETPLAATWVGRKYNVPERETGGR
jgi:hypothetical protein